MTQELNQKSDPETIYIRNLIPNRNSQVYCIHHTDQDGIVSAILLKTIYANVWFIGTNYGKTIDYNQIRPGSIVYLVDYTLPVNEMRMLTQYNTVIYIDHHETPFEKEYEEFRNVEGIRSRECAACKLVWRYLHPNQPCPRFVQLTSDYDTWDFTDPDTLPVHYGIELYNINPRSCTETFLNKLLYNDDFMSDLKNMGKRIADYVVKRNEILSEDASFISEINGHKVLCMNIRNTNSMVLDAAAKKHPEIKLRSTFGYNSSIRKYKCSLYCDSKELICQEIDDRLKGHTSAAGMECELKDLPYPLPTPSLKEPNSPDYISELESIINSDSLIKKHESSSIGYLCRLNGYPSKFEGMSVFAVNHPFWTGDAMYSTNLITEYEAVVFWNLTSSGWFRYRIYPLERNRQDLKSLQIHIPGSKIMGQAVWCYRTTPLESILPAVDPESSNFTQFPRTSQPTLMNSQIIRS